MTTSDVDSVTAQLAKTTVEATSVLSFAGRSFKLDTEADAAEIVEAINKCGDLKALNLEGNTLGVDAAKAIAKALQTHPEFQRALWSDMFTGRLKTEIPDALRYLGSAIMLCEAKLVELDLSDNAFGPNGMKGLTELLKSSSCYTLKELKLNNNGLGITGGKMLAKSLLECHAESVKAGIPLALEVFVSGRGRLENEGSMALAEAFKAMGSLQEVSMPQNGINHEGITALAEAFSVNKNLRLINLNDNTFTEKGAKAMSKALPKLQNLEVVNFGDCLLRNGGAKSIAEGLKEGHEKLKELIVSFNEIRKTGATMIADCMAGKDSLQKLELDGNQLGEDGKELVMASLETISKSDVLGSLSDDEGTDEEEEDEEEEGEIVEDTAPSVQGTSLTPRADKSISMEDFLQFPSPTKLHAVGSKRAEALVENLGTKISDIDASVKAVCRVSTVVTQQDDKTFTAACECADAVFSRLYKDEDNVSAISNSVLVHLGLIKGEDRKMKPPSDITGFLLVLSHVVKQPYFPKSSKDVFQIFLTKPHDLLEKSSVGRHQLLQSLYT